MTPERRRRLKEEVAIAREALSKMIPATTPPPPAPEAPKLNKKQRNGLKYQEKKWNLPTRLPNGSCFNVIYDAATQTWSGVLIIDGVSFDTSHSAVFKLLRKLDQMYRESLPKPDVDFRASTE